MLKYVEMAPQSVRADHFLGLVSNTALWDSTVYRNHLVKKKVGVKGPPIPLNEILKKSHGSSFLLSKI